MGLVRGSSIHSVGVQINSELRTECAASAQPGHIAAVTAPCLPAARRDVDLPRAVRGVRGGRRCRRQVNIVTGAR